MKDKTRAMRDVQEKNISSRMERIELILQQMRRNKITPKNLTLISFYVSERLTEIEASPCSASTLRRNGKYRQLLQSFMNDMGYERQNQTVGSSRDVLSLQLRIKELERENSALEINLSQVLSQLSLRGQAATNIVSSKSIDLPEDISRICKIIYNLMEALDAFEIDLSQGTVVDNVTMARVFTRETFPEFFKWYQFHNN